MIMLNKNFTKDGEFYYFQGAKVHKVKGTVLKPFQWHSINTEGHGYFFKSATNREGFKTDFDTFEEIDRDYAKNKGALYYQGNKVGENINIDALITNVFGALNNGQSVVYLGKRLTGVDIDTFEILDQKLARDKNHVYQFGYIIPSIKDPLTFEAMDMPFFKDKYALYIRKKWDYILFEQCRIY